jgi:hypothetical protein
VTRLNATGLTSASVSLTTRVGAITATTDVGAIVVASSP